MTFADIDLARRLEGAEGSACREFAEARQCVSPEIGSAWMKCAGATVVFDGVESPITQTFGVGVFEPLTASALDEIERFFVERGAPVMHEVSPFAGVEALSLLCERGYRPMELSSVMHRPVEASSEDFGEGIRVRIAGEGEAAVWADVSARGWGSEHPELVDAIRAFGELSSGRRNSISFLSEVDGVPAAAGGLSICEGVALFAGAATLPEYRRRGLQAALLQARMGYAKERGYDLAMMVAEVGSQSQRNAERQGFRIAYTRTKWRLCDGSRDLPAYSP